jgi:peptidoglycan/LPS O-acetylase OafA/YrhL
MLIAAAFGAVALLLSIAIWRDPITSKWLEIVGYKLTFVYNLFGTRQLAGFVNAMPVKGTLSHVWSVNAEEQFYLLAPLLLVVGARYAGRSIAVWPAISLGAFLFVPAYAAIALGVLAAIVARRHGDLHLTPPGRAALTGLLVVGVTGLALDLGYETFAPIASIAIVLLLAVPGRQHPGGAVWGGMSYPLYLNHWIAIYAANFLRLSHPIRHVLVLALAIAIATVLYWWIDRPLLARRPKLYTRARGRAVTLTAYATVALGIGLGIVLWHSHT